MTLNLWFPFLTSLSVGYNIFYVLSVTSSFLSVFSPYYTNYTVSSWALWIDHSVSPTWLKHCCEIFASISRCHQSILFGVCRFISPQPSSGSRLETVMKNLITKHVTLFISSYCIKQLCDKLIIKRTMWYRCEQNIWTIFKLLIN